jgi:glycosyltransferase involved in cell wall biosynthesis
MASLARTGGKEVVLRKKIAHVTFDMRIGGAEQVICNLMRNTDAATYDVRVLCLERSVGPFGLQLQRDGFEVASFRRKPGFDWSLIGAVRDYIRTHGINVLHCHQYTPFVYGALAAAFTETSVVFTEHGRFFPDRRRLKRVWANRLLRLLTDDITAISAATGKALTVYEGLPKDRIRIIYNGIDVCKARAATADGLKAALGIPEDASVLGTIARLDAIKNHPMMIEGLRFVHRKHPNTYLLIVGDGEERARIERQVSELELGRHVILTGYRQDAAVFYQVMDLFLLTSRSEGTAMTLLEAMANGVPCIATDVGGNAEVVKDRETGAIVRSNDPLMLAETIDQLLDNRMLREEMGRAGRKRFEDEFTVERMVKEYQRVYDGVTKGGNRLRDGRLRGGK